MRALLRLCLVWCCALISFGAESNDHITYFETHVRPVLDKYCYECHGEKKHKGGLRLDSKAGWEIGGDSGPALIPGNVEKSLLITAIRYLDDDTQMPPKNRLPDTAIAALEKWVAMGAPDPRTTANKTMAKAINWDEARQHWAYRPLLPVAVPHLQNNNWIYSPIDAFIWERLQQEKLTPTKDAPPAVLLRRLFITLIGLPPNPEQLSAFEADPSPDAYTKHVDDLLASHAFAERFARHWLDVARYAESVSLRGQISPHAWRYRDWVIHAFDRDLPYDQFITQQLAGDLLPASTASLEQQQLQMAATSFLLFANANFENQDKKQLEMDLIDEQLDTIGKAFMGQTLGCARCHDHKFDPIPTSDYYAMAGILSSTNAFEHDNVSRWLSLPLPITAQQKSILQDHKKSIKDLTDEIAAAKKQLTIKQEDVRDISVEHPAVVALNDLAGIVVDSNQAMPVGNWKQSQHSKYYVGDGYLHDENEKKGTKSLTFTPALMRAGEYEVRLAYSSLANRASNVPVTILHADGETQIDVDQRKSPPINGHFVSLGTFRFEVGNQGYVLISNTNTDGYVIADAVQWLPIDSDDKKTTVTKNNSRSTLSPDLIALEKNIADMEKRFKSLQKSAPLQPYFMGVTEAKSFADSPIYIRGNVHAPSTTVPRGFLQIAAVAQAPAIPHNQSGRLQLAEWLTAKDHPLTARVMVNRLWHWIYGQGLSRTVDNFGTTGETPSHPELLDYLAQQFIAEKWSMKTMIKQMVLSRTFREGSRPPPYAHDPDNRLLARAHRRFMEAEVIRDAMIFVSGELQPCDGGRTWPDSLKSDYNYTAKELTRSIYLPLFRNSIPDIFTVFDLPSTSSVNGARHVSMVAPQALYMMNSPFAMDRAAAMAKRLFQLPLSDDSARADYVYRALLGRLPTAAENVLLMSHLHREDNNIKPTVLETRWAAIIQALYASPKFRIVE